MKRSAGLVELVSQANRYLEHSADEEASARKMIASLVTSVLMARRCYHGFNYLYWDKQGCGEWEAAGKPDFPEKFVYIFGPSDDKTRVFFY